MTVIGQAGFKLLHHGDSMPRGAGIAANYTAVFEGFSAGGHTHHFSTDSVDNSVYKLFKGALSVEGTGPFADWLKSDQ